MEEQPDFPDIVRVRCFLEELEAADPEAGDEPGIAEGQGVALHRLAFTEVDARRTNGHVQGIAARFGTTGDTDEVTLYASLSDFPPGWGACLIDQGRRNGETDEADEGVPFGMEAMLLPQGRHPGGINICDDLLVIPLEHDGREARLYFYDVASDPLYPRQVGAFDPATFERHAWPRADGDNPAKASAAAIAHMTSGLTAPTDRDELGANGRFLVVVLADKRYLRFLEFERRDGGVRATGRVGSCDLGEPEGFVDNISLVNLSDGGWGLFLFEAADLSLGDLQRAETIDRVIFWRLTFDQNDPAEGDGSDLRPQLSDRATAAVGWSSDSERAAPKRGERCWPGFRWGASVTWTGSRLGLFMAEWFGDEQAFTGPDDETSAGIMYVQFATNLDEDPFGFAGSSHFGAGHAKEAKKPTWGRRWWRNVRDIFPVIGMVIGLGGRWLVGVALLIIAIAVFTVALLLSGLTVSLLLAGAGSLLGLIAIGMIGVGLMETIGVEQAIGTEAKAEAIQKRERYTVRATQVAMVTTLGAAAAVDTERSVFVAVFAIVALVAIAVLYHLRVRRWLDRTVQDHDRNRTGFIAALIVSCAIAALAPLAVGFGGDVAWVGVVVVLLAALAAIKFLAWPALGGQDGAPFSWPARLAADRRSAAGFVGGVAVASLVLTVAGEGWGAVTLLAWSILVGVSIWGAVEYRRQRPSLTYRRSVLIGGCVTLLAAIATGVWFIPDPFVALFVVLVGATIGAFIVWPGEGVLLLVMVAFVASWAAIDTDHDHRDEPLVATAATDAPVRWVIALGDSFISGEGAQRFNQGTNIPGVNSCRRAPTAWPELVAAHLGRLETASEESQPDNVDLVSFACSGATIANMVRTPQYPGAAGDAGGRVDQLTALANWLPEMGDDDEVAYVLVSAGGNDAGFADVIQACLLPASSCADDVANFERRATQVGQDLVAFLGALETTLGDAGQDATVIVNPYLNPLGLGEGTRCGTVPGYSLISAEETASLGAFHDTLNTQLGDAVINATAEDTGGGLQVLFNDAGQKVQGNLCGGGPGSDGEVRQNWLVLQPPDEAGQGPLAKFRALLPSSTWIQGSVHPNETGHAAIAETVCALVNVREVPTRALVGCSEVEADDVESEGDPDGEDLEPVNQQLSCDSGGPADGADSPDAADAPPCPELIAFADGEAKAETDAFLSSQRVTAVFRVAIALTIALAAGALLGSSAAHNPGFRVRPGDGVGRSSGH